MHAVRAPARAASPATTAVAMGRPRLPGWSDAIDARDRMRRRI